MRPRADLTAIEVPGVDVLIRGAGPAGCALALALGDSPHRVAIAASDAASDPATSAFRPIALSYASRLILERIGAWHGVSTSPIDTVQVSQQGAFGLTRLTAADANVPALGYVVDYRELVRALRGRLRQAMFQEPTTLPRCTVHAEGGAPDARHKRYGQDAVVAVVRFSRKADAVAHERFTPEGPLALLPFQDRFALVWSTRQAEAQRLAQCEAARFLQALQERAGPAFGRAMAVEGRQVQPLSLRVRPARVGPREVFIGNAAQTLHPVAGQGLNLALRDAWDLAQALSSARDPGDAGVLRRYAATRRADALATIGVTDMLAEAFLGASPMARGARALALTVLDILPPARRFFARRMIFGPSALP